MPQTPPFFAGVPTAEVEALLSGLARRRFPAGAVVLAEGDYRGEMYVLSEGTAEVVLTDRHGSEHVVSSIQTGETIGEMSLLTQSPASATVRAVDDAELLVLPEEQLEGLMGRLPELQHNVVATLSARLARVTRLAAQEEPGRLVLLDDAGGPDLLGHALAASVAWHTRGRTVHVVLADSHSEALRELATLSPEPPFRGRRVFGSELLVARPDGAFAGDRIEGTLEELVHAYDHVLLQVPRAWARRPAAERTIRLGSSDPPVPALTVDELSWLERGLLPARGPAGIALGRVARDLAGLKVGLALGAGSMRGYAHIGALRALERHEVPADCLAGSSIGATVAALYAGLGDLDRVEEILDGIGARMFRPTLSRKSLLTTAAMRRYVRRAFGDPALEELRIPLGVVATDVDTQDEVVLRRGSSVAAVFASAAVPGVFPAVRIGSHTLVDGGIVNPVPVTVAATMGADVVVGIRLVHGGGVQLDEISEAGEGPVPSAVAAIMRSIELMQTRIATDGGSVPTIILTPEFGRLPAGKLRHFRDGRRFVAAGEEAVEAALPRLSAALPWLRPLDLPDGASSPPVRRTSVTAAGR